MCQKVPYARLHRDMIVMPDMLKSGSDVNRRRVLRGQSEQPLKLIAENNCGSQNLFIQQRGRVD